ncbi:RNA polymerase sigma factor [Cellulomonas sp.]|uniref:RNA polymerase sigma factor n=1 Tax=Cellulomonas sp. TaxID=40001 RepID=UPI003BAB4AE4
MNPEDTATTDDRRDSAHRTAETVWRMESAAVVAVASRVVGDIGIGEEIAQDAFVAALEQWPADGVPPNPAGWLVTTARHKALDLVRRRGTYARKLAEVGRSIEQGEGEDVDALLDDHIGDDLLRLVFTTCHPALTSESRVALTLRLLGGLRTDEVARGLLISEATAAQRVSRAKRTLAREGVRFELPAAEAMPDRLASVLDVVYLVFNEGYVATSGDEWSRPELCHEAIRLARVLCALLPDEASVHALDALLELQASRLPGRVTAAGTPVPLLEQDRRLWDRLLIRRGTAALERAHGLGGARGPYALQAAISLCHATAATAADTDWPLIAGLYAQLAAVSPSPVVSLNRAVALGMAGSPAEGLTLLDEVDGLADYPLRRAARGQLLEQLGRTAEAAEEFRAAAEQTRNAGERGLLRRRADALL